MMLISCRVAAIALAFLLFTPGGVPSGSSGQALADSTNPVPVAQEDIDDGGPVCSDFDGDGECDIAPPHD
jgi:hypothetical protein